MGERIRYLPDPQRDSLRKCNEIEIEMDMNEVSATPQSSLILILISNISAIKPADETGGLAESRC